MLSWEIKFHEWPCNGLQIVRVEGTGQRRHRDGRAGLELGASYTVGKGQVLMAFFTGGLMCGHT